ncbi:MAG TPA: LPS export ABC transporter permease LptG [Chiayiivirga sp.]|jgi:lipopolysaccharide export system permease protein|uniref:LPS export ABC transporter permease LptG n=1 Tax=Denitratimonas tolerans TaxID=1338420 RepID=A0AAW9R6K6_9GAMM|nr:LPS export ABC transporter permease LptG [Xanthomonadaceae bacterium]MDX9765313.1 LPS export ABC transporter permease LptG [Chiayiivirga sp.]HRN59066.1 LPS export ABC transporter permease LptG [Chiayiivirga sp.]HRO87525.1 LPS export ABC transporter permease LptG [Chiayiivirga sp.]HRQ35164.1 LPS export ABC transporter permease LptG [Chiayiivirga sp.]
MRWRFGLADRMIALRVAAALSAAWFVLVGFDAITALVGQLANIGQGSYGFSEVLIYTVYTLPRRAYTLFPTAAVIGALLGLGALAASSELTALRAIGLSRARICVAAVAVIALLTLAMVIVAETIGPAGEEQAQTRAMEAKSSDIKSLRGSGLWAREGDTFLNAKQGNVVGRGADSTIELSDVTLYEFDQDGRLASIAVVQKALHHSGVWELRDVHRSRFGLREVVSEQVPEERWASRLNPDVLQLGVTRPRYLRMTELRNSLEYLVRNELDMGEFESAYWARIFYPFSTLVLCLAALPFAFGTLRSGGFGKRLFVGIVLGVGMFTAQTLSVNLAQVYHLDLRLAYGLPPLLVALVSWLHFRGRQ